MTMSFRGTVNPMTTTAVDQHVVSVDLPIMWEPNAPEARLTATDHGEARLTLRPHPDDHDQGQVELVWTGCCATRMDATNDEAIGGHQLYEAGLRDVSTHVYGGARHEVLNEINRAEAVSNLLAWIERVIA